MTAPDAADQLSLVPRRASRRRPSPTAVALAGTDPVAQVMIDAQVPHLDRVFDYTVPASMADAAVPGVRVRVRFAGRLTNGYVVGRLSSAEHVGDLRPLERVIGVEPVLTAETLGLVADVAERYAGTFSDVVRAAVPPRHARAEGTDVAPADWVLEEPTSRAHRWDAYENGGSLLKRLSTPSTGPTRAVWSAAPSTSSSADLAALVDGVLGQPRGGVIVVVPDAADVERVLAELDEARRAGAVATLTADQGPERRYREFVRILRGGARVVVGTRASVFAPVRDLRLIVVWDDGDDALGDSQAPYWDARDVAALRSHRTGCDLVVGAPARSVTTQQWVESGWARSVAPTRDTVVALGPTVRAQAAEDSARDEAAAAARIPHRAWEVARTALTTGPVLVQVARRGYLPAMSCQSCRELARCTCGGPLELRAAGGAPQCAWCGALVARWSCPACGGGRLRAVSIGAERTAEEIGRAFPGVPVVSSHAGHMVEEVPDEPGIVVATPGAEPMCDPGYRAVLLLDARAQLARPRLDAAEDAARRWFAAARLAAPGAPVVVTAENALPAVQALVRWDAPWLAARELRDRAAAGLPPATRMAALVGEAADIIDVAEAVGVPHRLLGPVPAPERRDPHQQRGLVVVAREHGPDLSRQLRAITATRSAQAKSRPVHVRMDPREV